MGDAKTKAQTPIEVIALVSRIVTMVVDRITGDRSDFPLLVAYTAHEALNQLGARSQVMFGEAAWIEVMPDHSLAWAGCWNGNITFWLATEHGEVVDLNTAVAHRKRAHDNPQAKALFSPPLLWALDVPMFYRYIPEGIAELELTDEKDIRRYETILREVREKCTPAALEAARAAGGVPEFPNEPILCPGRRLLDDSTGTFKQFDRALSVRGIPQPPI